MNGTNHESRRNPMLTEGRWGAEVALMANLFPAFRPFTKEGFVGFHGLLQGPCSGRTYAVIIRAPIDRYPDFPPAVYLNPKPEPTHCDRDGQLDICVQWKPIRHTFTKILFIVVAYIRDFDDKEN